MQIPVSRTRLGIARELEQKENNLSGTAMPPRRILSLWFPRLGAEHQMRRAPHLANAPFAVIRDAGQMQRLCSLSPRASQAGLQVGQPLRDAHAMCANLLTRLENPHVERAFLGVLHRWAGKYSPWVAQQKNDALVLDITGCAHLFGGEEALCEELRRDCGDLGLSVRLGIADTLGAAWALARFSAMTTRATAAATPSTRRPPPPGRGPPSADTGNAAAAPRSPATPRQRRGGSHRRANPIRRSRLCPLPLSAGTADR